MRIIDADALIKQLKSSSAYNDYEWSMYADGFIEDIENAPTIDVVPKDFHDKTCEAMAKRHTEEIQRLMPKRGEWIEVDDVSISCRCSVCGWEAHLYEDDVYGMPYCPNCGARMKGADDE